LDDVPDDQAVLLQAVERAADGAARDAELFDELPLGGQARAGTNLVNSWRS
jgi:hypothetical protein